MQTVYVVVSGFDYEASYVESVHSTREGAEAAVAVIKAKDYYLYDYVGIEEHTLKA